MFAQSKDLSVYLASFLYFLVREDTTAKLKVSGFYNITETAGDLHVFK